MRKKVTRRWRKVSYHDDDRFFPFCVCWESNFWGHWLIQKPTFFWWKSTLFNDRQKMKQVKYDTWVLVQKTGLYFFQDSFCLYNYRWKYQEVSQNTKQYQGVSRGIVESRSIKKCQGWPLKKINFNLEVGKSISDPWFSSHFWTNQIIWRIR